MLRLEWILPLNVVIYWCLAIDHKACNDALSVHFWACLLFVIAASSTMVAVFVAMVICANLDNLTPLN